MILPSESNKDAKEPAKVPEHVENYRWLFEGVTGKAISEQEIVSQSERVYNFQRVFNLRMGFGTREWDYPPYRMVGPVTNKEYESRQDRYDTQLKNEAEIDPAGMTTAEKVAALRKYREERYNMLMDEVYKRRGWTENGVPKAEFLKEIGIDMPDVPRTCKAARRLIKLLDSTKLKISAPGISGADIFKNNLWFQSLL